MRSIRMIRWTLLPIAALLATAGMAHATSIHSVAITRTTGNNHAKQHVVGRLATPLQGTHYVYGWDGTCPDGIDVYQATGTGLSFVQNVSGFGCSGGTFFGAHHLAVVRTPANCLIFDDGDGNVYSFTIDASNGTLSSSPVSSAYVGGFPEDLAVSGSIVYESNSNTDNPSPTIDVLTVGDDCGLTLDSQNSTGAEDDINIAVSGASTIVSTDINSGDMVAYTLQENGTLAETAVTSGQIGAPDSVADTDIGSGHSLVFTGQALEGPPQTQGFIFSAGGFAPLPGSPQTSSDPNSSVGAAVALSVPNRLLLQGDVFSGQVGWDTLTGGRMTYAGDTSLAENEDPTELTVAGNELLVAQAYDGDVEACGLSSGGASHCRTVATLTGAGSGVGGSTAVF